MRRYGPQWQLLGRALLALFAGFFLYLLTRDPPTVSLFRLLPLPTWPGEHLHCWLCGVLPSLLHVYAFILLSALILQPQTRKQVFVLCLFWSGIETLFELGQIDAVAVLLQHTLPLDIEHNALLSVTRDYFLFGTFDPLDLLFVGLGALAAYRSLTRMATPEVQHDHAKDDNPLSV